MNILSPCGNSQSWQLHTLYISFALVFWNWIITLWFFKANWSYSSHHNRGTK
uniref:Uncharacterized protein n=1 Tax=Zea mays TaxID=4577 RepID=C0PMT2_MAIZE|nr:unknown [Zea mays]